MSTRKASKDSEDVILLESDSDEEDEDESEDESRSKKGKLKKYRGNDEGEDEEESEESEEESGSEDSVWESFGNAKTTETQEANEATAMQKYHHALEYVVAGKPKKAARIFKRILKNPLVSCFHKSIVDWEAETDDKLSKMARLFVGSHKNLAILEKHRAEKHYIQVLAVSPHNNSKIWMDLGFCTLEKGDLAMAKYAFKRSNSDEGTEALISVLYLAREYHACLEYIKELVDSGSVSKMMTFLKEKIRDINLHYRQFHDELFQENRDYDERIYLLTDKEVEEFSARVEAAETKLRSTRKPPKKEKLKPIHVEIDMDQTCDNVLTIFCDMFDRIESYSSISRQLLYFHRWEDRLIFVDCREMLDSLLDVIDVNESLVDKTCEKKLEVTEEVKRSLMLADRRKSTRLEGLCNSPHASTRPSSAAVATAVPETELSSLLNLECGYVLPLRSNVIRPSRTPSPTGESQILNENMFLDSLRSKFAGKRLNLWDLIETSLLSLAEVCPDNGTLSKELIPVVTQLYRRLNLMCSDLSDARYLKLHVLMDDLAEPQGRDYSIRWQFNNKWPSRDLALRYSWNTARYSTKESVKLEYLDEILRNFSEDDIISTASGFLTLDDIEKYAHKIRKNERIQSVTLLREARIYDQVVSIMKTDIDFNAILPSELPTMLDHWFTSLFALELHSDAAELLCRALQHLHELGEDFAMVDSWLSQLDTSKISIEWLNSLGFCLCYVLTKKNSFPLWKTLYNIVHAVEGTPSIAYIQSLDSSDDYEAMPSRSVEVLVKAHEALGTAGLCGTNQGEFLKFMMKEMNVVFKVPEVCETLHKEENTWLLSNLQEEIGQCLHCSFGRFCKRRKQMNDHNCRSGVVVTDDIVDTVISLAIPRPLPRFEDKERLGHDLPDLLASKIPNYLKFDEKRQKKIDKFEKWLRQLNREALAGGRVKWPQTKKDSSLRAQVWYVMALHNYRQNNHADTRLYAELFLTSRHADYENSVTLSAWAMLSFAIVCETFKLPDESILREWEWRTMAYRIAVSVDNTVGVVHFHLASTLYQMASLFSRYIENLPSDDFRKRFCPSIADIRNEARLHFESVLTLPAKDCRVEEFQWLSFFFLAKLHAKISPLNIIKVVDNFFEAACSCELGDFFWYPQKIKVKKQQNLEPVELHYQLHNAIWKYIRDTENPPLDVLVTLLGYTRAFKMHKVVKSGNSLFSINREVYETVLRLTIDTAKETEYGDEIHELMHSMVEKVDIKEELWNICYGAFELVCDRFPHRKAYYRLAEMDLYRNNLSKAHDHLIRGALRRRKKEDGFFDHYMEFSCQDIERISSFDFHLERTARLTIAVLRAQDDLVMLLQMLYSLIFAIGEKDDTKIRASACRELSNLVLRAVEHSLKATSNSPKQCKTEIVSIWQRILKYPKCQQILSLRRKLISILEPKYGSIEKLVADHVQKEEATRKQGRKRKGAPVEAIAPRPPQPPAPAAAPVLMPQAMPSDPMMLINMMLVNAGIMGQL